MLNNEAKPVDSATASVETADGMKDRVDAGGVFYFKCYDKDGNLKWGDHIHNLVVNEGLKDMSAKYFSGTTYTAAWYLGLITGPADSTTIAAGDTLASHIGWVENTSYSGNRKTVTFGVPTLADPSVISNSGSPAQFLMNDTATIAGAFLASVSTGSAGILFSASDFQAPGDRSVVNGDTLNVTYQFSLDAA
jgi:hypothetical protein